MIPHGLQFTLQLYLDALGMKAKSSLEAMWYPRTILCLGAWCNCCRHEDCKRHHKDQPVFKFVFKPASTHLVASNLSRIFQIAKVVVLILSIEQASQYPLHQLSPIVQMSQFVDGVGSQDSLHHGEHGFTNTQPFFDIDEYLEPSLFSDYSNGTFYREPRHNVSEGNAAMDKVATGPRRKFLCTRLQRVLFWYITSGFRGA